MKVPLFVLICTTTGSCLCLSSISNLINAAITQDVDALQQAIYFVQRNYRQFNVDGLLGLVLTEGYLLKAQSLIASDVRLWEVLKRSTTQIRVLRIKIDNVVTSTEEWQHPENYINIFDPPYFNERVWEEINNSRVVSYNFRNITVKSDDCFSVYFRRIKLMKCPEDRREIHFYENICKGFVDGGFSTENVHGYSLKHYLLMRQIIGRVGHDARPLINLQAGFNRKLCYFMLTDAQTILMNKNKFGDSINRDLYLESVVLCRLEGHFSANFLMNGREKLTKWQTSSGCFSLSAKHLNFSLRKTRKISARSAHLIGNVNDYCTDH